MGDDESDTASEIDYSDLSPHFTSKADCNHPFDADGGPMGGQALRPGTAPPFYRPATDCDNDETNKKLLAPNPFEIFAIKTGASKSTARNASFDFAF